MSNCWIKGHYNFKDICSWIGRQFSIRSAHGVLIFGCNTYSAIVGHFLSPGFLFYFIYLFSFKESQIFVITKCYVDICRRCITHDVDTSAVQSEIAGSGIEDLIRQRQIVLICCSKEVTTSSSFPIYFQSLVTESMIFIMWKALRIFSTYN